MNAILSSEFVWGIIIGLLLTAIGAYGQSWLTAWHQRREKRQNMARYCLYMIRTLKRITKDMEANAERSGAIFHEFLNIIDIEIGVFTRNREGVIFLSSELRDDMREFVDDVTTAKSKIASSLNLYYDAENKLFAARNLNNLEEIRGWETVSAQRLNEAAAALNKIGSVTRDADALSLRLEKIT